MKNYVFLTSAIGLFFIFIIILPATGQIGIKSGPGVSDITFLQEGQVPYLGHDTNSLEHRKPKLSFQLGAFSTFTIGKRWELQPELLFALKGLNYSEETIYDNITHKINITYLELPLLMRYKFFLKERRQSGLFVGPFAALKLSANLITEVEGKKEKSKVSNVNNFDFGIVAGYSFDIGLPTGDLIIDFRTSYSLINMMNVDDGYIPWYYGPSEEYARNVSITLTVGYRFISILPKDV